jgi:two-component system, cell cycle response regulator DivK
MDITLPSGSWQTAALPSHGWPVFHPLRSPCFLCGSILNMAFAVLFFQILRISGALRQEIGERLDAEDALRRSEEKYRSIFENSVMGIFRTTPDGRYLSANPAGVRMHGYESQEEMIQSVTDMARSIKPDLILLDIQLPVMDGYAVARQLRAKPELAPVLIVAVTSYAMTGGRERTIEAGCNGYIEKPINPDTFLEQIEQYRTPKGVEEKRGGGDEKGSDCR